MLTGLIRLLLVLGAIILVRRVVLGLFRGSSGEKMRNPHPRRNPPPDGSAEQTPGGPQQPIEEADYEDLE